jgi:L-ascorbate metabolism protein UlaG (beta-lactamase superfamily)
MLKRIMIAVVILILIVPALFFVVGAVISAPSFKGNSSDHFNGKKFFNPYGTEPHGIGSVIKWMWERKQPTYVAEKSPSYGKHPLASEKENIRITFINHSTFLIQVDGVNILTDPIWSERASPFTWAGPKRVKFPGIKMEDLPRIHAVVISHNHYDHLDIHTMRTIFGAHHPKIFTPLGVKSYFDEEQITGVTDLDWWNEVSVSDSVKVQAVPAQHFSGRGVLDRDATLWAGYVIKTSKGNVYFAGDTGYNEKTFKEIGDKAGPMAVSLLPIGAYLPRWFMSPVHTSPEEAVKIHQDVRSTNSIGMHFGTFPLADEEQDQSGKDLRTAMARYNLNENVFVTLKEGDVKIFE